MTEDKKEIFFSEKTGKTFAIGGLIFIGLAAVNFLILGNWTFSKILDEEKIAQFGDFIGGIIGSIFSLAGVILFYVAIKEQRKDININQENLRLQNEALNQQVDEFKAQKTELIATRKVYEEQTLLFREQTNLYIQQNKDLKEQTNIAKLQQFDSSFFSYLNVFIELKNTLDKKTNNISYFDVIYNEISEVNIVGKSLVESIEILQKKYLEVFCRKKNELSLYFKTLYRIIILIDSSSLEDDKKNQYFKLLRSQLSNSELLVLYYNYLNPLGVKVRPYVIRYDLLKHIGILDKIEIASDIPEDAKFEFEDFLSKIGAYILEGYLKFTSIEEPEDVHFSNSSRMFGIDIGIKLVIESDFQFSLFFRRCDFENHRTLTKDRLKNLVSRHIYAILFLNRFKIPEENQIEISFTEKVSGFEFNFKIENLKNI